MPHPLFRSASPARSVLAFALACAGLGVTAQGQPASEARFDLLEFEIGGNTTLATTAIEQAVLPFLGPQRGMEQVEAARAALERAYQQAGFLTVLVDVPEQRVDEGVVRLQVVEGRVNTLRVTGSRYFSQGHIRNTVAELQPGSVPNFNVVQTQIDSLNRTEDRRVQPVLKPGPVPNTVDVELKVADRLPASASLELHNRHAAATTPWRLQANLAYNNLWQRSHSLSVTAITAPANTEESSLLVGSYSVPMGDATLTAYAVASDSLVQPLSAVTVAGKGLNLGLRWLQRLSTPWPTFSHGLQWGVDYKDFETTTRTGDVGVLTPLRYLPLQLAYNAASFAGNTRTTLNMQGVWAQRGILQRTVNCADAGPADQFACSAKDAQGSFAYWRGELNHTRPGWRGTSLNLRAGWQLSPDVLVSNERYAIGGAQTVRGYTEAVASGDRALLLGLEWRTPNLAGKDGWAALRAMDELGLYAFADAGFVKILNPLPEQAISTRLRGVGLGLQFRRGQTANGQLDLALPLDATAEHKAREPRLHVRMQLAL